MKKPTPWLIALLAFSVMSCSLPFSFAAPTGTPVPSQTALPKTASPTAPKPTATPAPSLPPQPTLKPSANPALPLVYYYFIAIPSQTYPAGSVVILDNILVLGPTLSNIARSPDTATNVAFALQAMIKDPRNAWKSDDLSIAGINFTGGNISVALKGKLIAPGDVVLIAARMQILLTIFAEADVLAAAVTLNGDNIANLGISHSSEAKPTSYSYTRTDIEKYMSEHAYKP